MLLRVLNIPVACIYRRVIQNDSQRNFTGRRRDGPIREV
eukprot:COSAG02_NODE_1034_length_15056_cov_2.888948_2_plen_39_part_00